MRSSKNELKYHLPLLGTIILMDFFSDYVYGGMKSFKFNFLWPYYLNVISFYLAFSTVYFLNFKLLAPATLAKKKTFPFLMGLLILLLVFAGLRFVFDEILAFSISGKHNYNEESRKIAYYIFDNTYYALKSILFSTSLFMVLLFNENKNKMHLLQLEQKKSELGFLKSQIGPHFLFNTLNTFYSELLLEKPDTAEDILKLSKLLRFVTYEVENDFISSEKDIQFIEDYIYFYEKRFENQLALDFMIQGNGLGKKIPSMVLIHFVENVFKHGLVTEKSDPATILVRFDEDYFEIKTRNKSLASENYMEGGIGQKSVQRRLEVLFPGRFELVSRKENDYFISHLKCPYA